MFKIHLLNSQVLREDLTGIASDAIAMKEHVPDLIRLCRENNGVGVAANQVGLRENFFFMTEAARVPTRKGGKSAHHLCVNPTWKPVPETRVVKSTEGCLSIPGREFVVPRHTAIQAEWDNILGHRQKKTLKGKPAIVFQHEHDHLRGVTLLESGKEVTE